ncbi:MAG: histidine phosphatase family protein [Acidimicrobiia bacterium]|nr:MAG: histidine phosphatase family protein [Acidimicrobiia bacterium]
MELLFIRHGQPAWSVDGLSQPDPHLTALGKRQADLAATRLARSRRPLSELVVSPAARALETAAPIAEKAGLSIETVDDIVEIKMPDWSGELEETVQRLFIDARDRPPQQWWEGMEGGESFRDFHDRITQALTGVLAGRGVHPDPGRKHLWTVEDPDQRIAVVAHGGTNAVAIGYLLGAEPTPWEWERFILYHASFARMRAIPLAGGYVWSLRTFNDREHLPEDARTR